jgi:two-component system CheB/CheR fusion protein
VVVDAGLRIVQFRGHTGPYLEPAPGEASLDVLKMAREGLGQALRRAVRAARQTGTPARVAGVRLRSSREGGEGGGAREIAVEITPLGGPDAAHFLVLFEEPAGRDDRRAEAGREDRAAALERELRAANAYLQATIEEQEATNDELETSNEELIASNEELIVSNEQLHSLNDELGAARAELEAVNRELRHRNEELRRANEDLAGRARGEARLPEERPS